MKKNENYLPVSEYFLSIQGEGTNYGKFALFLRFGICNIKCKFCDTKYSWNNYKFISENKIKNILKKYSKKVSSLVITGGEPTLHNLKNIINSAKKFNYYIAVETNGTIFQDWLKNVDFITVSPKSENIDKRVLKIANELKFVILNKSSFKLVEKFLPFENVILQPVDNNIKIAKMILKYIAKSNYKNFLRLGFQFHKILDVR